MDIVFLIVQNSSLMVDHNIIIFKTLLMLLATSVSSDIITAWKTKVISEESIEPHVSCLDTKLNCLHKTLKEIW